MAINKHARLTLRCRFLGAIHPETRSEDELRQYINEETGGKAFFTFLSDNNLVPDFVHFCKVGGATDKMIEKMLRDFHNCEYDPTKEIAIAKKK